MGNYRIDDILSGVLSGAKRVTNNVAKKANETVETAKISFAISNTEDKIADCKVQIGDIIFREYLKQKDFEGEIGDLCRKIDNLLDDIEVMRDKQAEIKKGKRCKACGEVNDDKNTFCAECGEKLDNGEEEF